MEVKISLTERNLDFERSCCPFTKALDIFADKWILLIIRDLILGKHRYNEFLSLPKILADRSKKLEIANLIVRRPYQQNPGRYECLLTKRRKPRTDNDGYHFLNPEICSW